MLPGSVSGSLSGSVSGSLSGSVPGSLSGSVPGSLSSSGSCDFVSGSGSCDLVSDLSVETPGQDMGFKNADSLQLQIGVRTLPTSCRGFDVVVSRPAS
jgi:hypothetical protein